jgi:Fur family transcriptional regulator, ferric uptake regulator
MREAVLIIEDVTEQTRAAPDSGDTVEQILRVLRRHGDKATPARRILLEILVSSRGHRSAEDLAAEVRARAPDIHLTMIYRNLEELDRLKIIDRTRLDHGPATYHLSTAAHGHLVCEHCGSMTEVPDALFQQLAQATIERYRFRIEPQRSALIGCCTNCALKP